MSRLTLRDPKPPEHAELRAAYEAESATVQRIADLRERRAAMATEVERLRGERDGMAGRLARGGDVTGADVRRAADALQDAETTLGLLTEALPKAARAAYRAEGERSAAEKPVIAAAYEPYRQAAREAERALEAAREACDRARVEADRLPADAQAALDAHLDGLGRDRWAPSVLAELRRVEQVNESIRLSGYGKMLEWP